MLHFMKIVINMYFIYKVQKIQVCFRLTLWPLFIKYNYLYSGLLFWIFCNCQNNFKYLECFHAASTFVYDLPCYPKNVSCLLLLGSTLLWVYESYIARIWEFSIFSDISDTLPIFSIFSMFSIFPIFPIYWKCRKHIGNIENIKNIGSISEILENIENSQILDNTHMSACMYITGQMQCIQVLGKWSQRNSLLQGYFTSARYRCLYTYITQGENYSFGISLAGEHISEFLARKEIR